MRAATNRRQASHETKQKFDDWVESRDVNRPESLMSDNGNDSWFRYFNVEQLAARVPPPPGLPDKTAQLVYQKAITFGYPAAQVKEILDFKLFEYHSEQIFGEHKLLAPYAFDNYDCEALLLLRNVSLLVVVPGSDTITNEGDEM